MGEALRGAVARAALPGVCQPESPGGEGIEGYSIEILQLTFCSIRRLGSWSLHPHSRQQPARGHTVEEMATQLHAPPYRQNRTCRIKARMRL